MDFKLYDEWMHPCGLYFLYDFLLRNGFDTVFYNCLKRSQSTKPKQNGTGEFPNAEIAKPGIYKGVKRKFKRYGVSQDEFTGFLLSTNKPDVIFLGSSMTYWAMGLAETIKIVTSIFPDIPCIVGGTAAHLIPNWIRSIPGVTHVFTGNLFNANDLKQSGIPLLSELTALPCAASMNPAFESMESLNHAPVMTSLGCPMSCSYCASKILCKTYTRRPVETVAAELALCVSEFDVSNAAFYDDALLFDAENNFIPFVNKIRDMRLPVQFHTPNGLHVAFMNRFLIDLMLDIGFKTIRLGYESGKLSDTRHTSGKTSFEQLAQKIVLMKSGGFLSSGIGVYLMAGLPGQTPQMVMEELAEVASLGVLVKPVFLSPVPHTALFESYSLLYPQILADPLTHNDSYFVTLLPQWDATAMQDVLDRAKSHNQKIQAPADPSDSSLGIPKPA